MLGKHSFSHPMHQRKNEIQKKYIYQFRNTKLKTKTNNAYLKSQNHHQILENDRLPMERERERERDGKKKYKVIKSLYIKKKKNQTSISNC